MLASDTCYTGCTTPTSGITSLTNTTPTTPAEHITSVPPTVTHLGGLALTGADIAELAVIGVAFIIAGVLLVRSRHWRWRKA